MKRYFERHVPHLPEKMLELVADLDSYPEFIPNCRSMKVRPADNDNVRMATMTLAFGPVTQGYTSRVTKDPENNTLTAKATDGPFAYLDSVWRFEKEGKGTCVRFELDFKISNPFIRAIAEPAFAAKQEEIMNAFVAEADRRFGS